MTGGEILADRSLPRRWARVLASDLDRPVVYDDTDGWLTRGELEWRSRTLATQLAACGLQRGDRILMSAAPSTALAVAHVGALRLGLVVVPMNTAYTAPEIAHVVGDARPVAVATDEPARLRLVEQAAAPRRLVTVSLDGVAGTVVAAPAGGVPPARPPVEPLLDEADVDDDALIVYTSGTTGTPKGALLSHGNLLASAEAVRLAWRWTEEDRLVLPLPLFHVHGLAVGLHGTLAASGSLVIPPRPSAAGIGAAIDDHDPTMLFAVPTIYSRLAGERRLGRLRLCVSGSAPLAARLHADIAANTGQVVLERYGMTETLMIASNPYEGERRAGTVGFPLPGVELRVAESGEVLVRGPNVFGGYFERPEATAEAFEGGWFRTGDLGRLDGDGYLRLVGRKSELVISGGYNVYPREVEDVLRGHPGVSDAAVVGWPDDEWGEQVVAFVVPAGPGVLDAGVLAAFAAERLAPYKRPRRIILTGELPRNALGKVLKAELAPPG